MLFILKKVFHVKGENMSEGYKTKFNIGDTVWFIEEETEYGKTCECCGGRLPDKMVKKVHKSIVEDIMIDKYSEFYNLSFPRSLPVQKLYTTKLEAEQHLND
jgi:hypothetical protein